MGDSIMEGWSLRWCCCVSMTVAYWLISGCIEGDGGNPTPYKLAGST